MEKRNNFWINIFLSRNRILLWEQEEFAFIYWIFCQQMWQFQFLRILSTKCVYQVFLQQRLKSKNIFLLESAWINGPQKMFPYVSGTFFVSISIQHCKPFYKWVMPVCQQFQEFSLNFKSLRVSIKMILAWMKYVFMTTSLSCGSFWYQKSIYFLDIIMRFPGFNLLSHFHWSFIYLFQWALRFPWKLQWKEWEIWHTTEKTLWNNFEVILGSSWYRQILQSNAFKSQIIKAEPENSKILFPWIYNGLTKGRIKDPIHHLKALWDFFLIWFSPFGWT